ncbi:MAG: hypothetical protein AAGB93_12625 [Planctomycetota bacterium]
MTTVGPEPPFLPLRILGAVLRWAPVWVPALLFWQITTGGLQPALAERSRLDGARPEVEQRHSKSAAEFERMAAERRAWEDPVYLERMRRAKFPSDAPADGLSRAGQDGG